LYLIKTEFNIKIIDIVFLTMIIISTTSIILFNIFLSTDIKHGMSSTPLVLMLWIINYNKYLTGHYIPAVTHQ